MNLEYRGYATAGQSSVLKARGPVSLQVMRPDIADMLTAEQPVPGLTSQNVSPFSHQLVRVKCAKGHEVELYLGNISRYSAEQLKCSPPCKYCSGSALCEDASFAMIYPDLAEHLYDTTLNVVPATAIAPHSGVSISVTRHQLLHWSLQKAKAILLAIDVQTVHVMTILWISA
jgi:hypothetical protein